MTKVLLADDHAMVRAGLRQFLVEDRSITEIGEAASGNETLDKLRAGSWDLVILDINMPDRSGLDILRYIRASYPDTKVLVLSGFPERQYAINVLKAGAGGYLPKECAPEELLKATRTVMQGRRYVSANLAELLLSDLNGDNDQPLHRRLSERDRTPRQREKNVTTKDSFRVHRVRFIESGTVAPRVQQNIENARIPQAAATFLWTPRDPQEEPVNENNSIYCFKCVENQGSSLVSNCECTLLEWLPS